MYKYNEDSLLTSVSDNVLIKIIHISHIIQMEVFLECQM